MALRMIILLGPLFVCTLQAQAEKNLSRNVVDPGVITTRQAITPAGVQSVFDGRVYGIAFGARNEEIVILAQSRSLKSAVAIRVDWKRNQVIERVLTGEQAGLQGVVFDPPSKSWLISGTGSGSEKNEASASRLMRLGAGGLEVMADGLGTHNAGAPTVAENPDPQGRRLVLVPLIHDNKVVVLDLAGKAVIGEVKVPVAPFAAVLASDGSYGYVSNWGGRIPRPDELSATTGIRVGADRVVIDERGILASGTVTRINLKTLQAEKILESGLHPTAMALDSAAKRLYVANTNDDTVSVIDTGLDKVTETWRLRPFSQDVYGLSPTAVLLSKDRRTLYVACGGINAVLVLDAGTGRQLGMIPTGWYPNGLALSPDGRHLAVSTLLGVGSGWQNEPSRRFVHAYRGTVHVLPLPDQNQLHHYTLAVAENNRMAAPERTEEANPSPEPVAIPSQPGRPSLIEHVVYIIKENRTYDQLFGDLEQGNGEPSFVLFGEGIADNHRKLAREFVLLDNFYASGGNSGDGHQWVTQANETAYVLWPAYQGRSYPFDGSDPIAYSSSGFIWDAATRRGRTVAVYGEYIPRMRVPGSNDRRHLLEQWKEGRDFSRSWTAKAELPDLQKLVASHYPSYTNAIPDVIRADIFLKDLQGWSRDKKMPHLVILQLPCDHTYGSSPGISTARAMVADNDLALGRIVEGLSRSPFWEKMAIFVVEDDAQNGVDHVDGHRTVALAISPYVRRGSVDSTFYAHQSMLKTIELILGLEPLTIFDRIANDMRNSFSNTADFAPYTAVIPKQDLFERNPEVEALRGSARKAAIASARMRWDVPDAVPSDELNRILWHSVKGWDIPFPGVRQSVFAPMSVDEDDEERERN
ncbi:MAG: alkaline phosphatase family protein [Acidobacteriota bacterium]